MINLEKMNVGNIVDCPSLGVAFYCETEEQKQSVIKFNERVKEG